MRRTIVNSHLGRGSLMRGRCLLNPCRRRVNLSLGSNSLFMESLMVVDMFD